MMLELAKRPRVIVNVQLSLNGAPIPAMSIVKHHISFCQQNGWLIDLLVRGFTVVLKPDGYVGYAVSNIVKMVIRLLPAPWELAIVPTLQEGHAWLDRVA